MTHAVRAYNFDGSDVRRLAWVTPLLSLATLLMAWWLRRPGLRGLSISFLAGIWLCGGVMMFVSASFTGGGFTLVNSWEAAGAFLLGLVLALIPIYTFIAAAYNGSLLALLLVSIALGCVAIISAEIEWRRSRVLRN